VHLSMIPMASLLRLEVHRLSLVRAQGLVQQTAFFVRLKTGEKHE
jgi:hypothetical protein